MLIKIISYIPAIVGILITGLFVYINNPKNSKNKVFGLMNLTIALWLLSLFFADITKTEKIALWLLRTGLFIGAFMYLLFFLFSLYFPYRTAVKARTTLAVFFPIGVIAVLSLTPFVVPGVSVNDAGAQPTDAGLLYTLSDTLGIVYLITGAIILQYKNRKATAMQKNQIKFVLIGLGIATFTNIFTNIVFTLLNFDSALILFGSVSLFVFSLFIAYAIIKHGFFDIRLIVARSVGYILTIGTIATIYSALIFGVLGLFVNNNGVTFGQQITYIIVAVFLSLTFQPLRKFFNRVSNKLFYQDAYDLKESIDAFGAILVASIDLNLIIKSTQSLLASTIRPVYSYLHIKNGDNEPYIYDSRGRDQISDDANKIIFELDRSKSSILFYDDLNENNEIKSSFRIIGATVALKLDTKTGTAGYVLLGGKQNGGVFTSQDLDLLTIMSNELALAVQNAIQFAQVSSFNLTLQKKVDDATVELRKTNEKLKELDQAKDEFISMASHQLRTPLTSVKGYVSMVLDGDVGEVPSEQKELLKQAFTSSQRMVYLISDLLNVSRLRTGKFVIENKDTNLADLVKTELEQLYETAESRGLKLVYDKPKRFPMVPIDETKIRQVVMNFVDNAIYYTPKGGTITVEVKETPKTIEFTSSDTGIGISKEAQKSLFGKFFRADNAKKARPDGTGLGLYMAKKVIVAQGGSLIFHSEEGKGSTFGFSLPKNIADRPKEMPSLEDEQEAPQASVAKTDHQIATAAGTHTIDEDPSINEAPKQNVASDN